jgi:predicted transcriptional regulator
MSEISRLEEEIQMLRREREQLGMRLLELQQRVTAVSLAENQNREREYNFVEDDLRLTIRELEAENAAIRGSLTWRASGPIRKLKHRFTRT